MANTPYISSTQVASSVPFDNNGVSFNSSDAQASLVEIRQHPVWDQDVTTTTLNGTLTLTVASRGFQLLNGTATGFNIVMPSALTLFLGQEYMIINQSNQTMTVKDGSGAVLFTLAQTSIGFLILQAAGSAGGTWVFWQTFIGIASGVVNYNVISSTNFSSSSAVDILIPGMTVTPQAGTYAIWYSAQNTAAGSGSSLTCTIYKGASPIADSLRKAASPAGTHEFFTGTQTVTQFDGATACSLYINPAGATMTVNQRSMLLIRQGV